MSFLISTIRQLIPGSPRFTEEHIPDLSGKVYIVTGANTGIGKVVAQILYAKNAAVWVAARNEEKGANAIAAIKEACPDSKGRLEYLHLDLSDLTTIKASAQKFLEKETRLDVLFNNAGVMFPPQGSKTVQGYELQIGTNNLGPFLFTKLLTPILKETAKTAPKASVRVIWVSSSAAEHLNPKGGVEMDNLDYKRDHSHLIKYGISKAGNYYHGTEFAQRHREDGIVSVSLNPGNLKTELDRHCNALEMIFRKATTFPAIYGAYTEVYAAFSSEVNLENSGSWIVPWGRLEHIRRDLLQGSKSEAEGGTGIAKQFWEWCDEQTKAYA